MMKLRSLAVSLALLAAPAWAQDLTIGYLRLQETPPPTVSDLDLPPPDLGIAGARLGIEDNATTGRFTGQTYALDLVDIAPGEDIAAAAGRLLDRTDLLVVDAPADGLLSVTDLPAAADAVVFNVAAPDNRLREDDCRANLLHALPSTAMRTDALAQFLVLRRWDELPMVTGGDPADQAFAASIEQSLGKFGLRVGDRKDWRYDTDIRRAATTEMPLFTQEFGRYDALIVADEIHDFARYMLYNTWEPRPIVGSEGLVPTGWHPVVEQWGARQLQNRFLEIAGRAMQPRDYAAWAAIRTLGEAATRTGSAEPEALRDYILGPDFELGGFLGRPLSFRAWNGQMRQPIPLVHPRGLVAQAPLDGFLHPVTELDTLGRDAPESQCTAFAD